MKIKNSNTKEYLPKGYVEQKKAEAKAGLTKARREDKKSDLETNSNSLYSIARKKIRENKRKLLRKTSGSVWTIFTRMGNGKRR